jgi:Cd2+/Zn2+-exporting ATPase
MRYGIKMNDTRIFVPAMDCPDEEREIRAALSRLPGVSGLTFHLFSRQVVVRHAGDVETLLAALAAIGMPGQPVDGSFRKADIPEAPSGPLRTFCAALALAAIAVALHLAGLFPGAGQYLFLPAVLAGGLPVAVRGWHELRNRSLGMNALMTVSIGGAAIMGELVEDAAVVTLFALANYLEAKSLDRARRATASLFDTAPEHAVVRIGGADRVIPAEHVAPGQLLAIRAGERIPVDAVVVEGASDVDEAVLTGESLPVAKSPGSQLSAGTVNGAGFLLAEALRPLSESTFARILRHVEEAQSGKAPIQATMERFAAIYTPGVLLVGIATALLPPLLGLGNPGVWAYRALVVLVIACPCAIVLAAPVAAVSALTRATRDGILVKGANALETLGRARAFAFDKTGTLTRGRLRVVRTRTFGGATEREVVRLAAIVEGGSAHPAAEAFRHEAARLGVAPAVDAARAERFTMHEGRGVSAEVDGRIVHVGNRRLFAEIGLPVAVLDPALARDGVPSGRTVSIVGDSGGVFGIIEMEDLPRDEAGAVVDALRRMGIGRLAMLTGDHDAVARASAAIVGIEEVHAELMPEDKQALVRRMVDEAGIVAFVGDGVNDAPALALASVGVAMGGAGSATAMDTADVVLMSGDLRRLPGAVRLGRRMVGVIRQNVASALLIKAAFLAAAAAGYASLWMAVAADMGTTLLVVFNGLRLLRSEGGTGRE